MDNNIEVLKKELIKVKSTNRRCLHKIKILRKLLGQKKIDNEVLHSYNCDLKREIKSLKKRKYNEINAEKNKSISSVAQATTTMMLQKTQELTNELLGFKAFLDQKDGKANRISNSPGYWINQIPKPSTSQNSNWNFMENGLSLNSIENNDIKEENPTVHPSQAECTSSGSSESGVSEESDDSDRSIFRPLRYPFKKRIVAEERLNQEVAEVNHSEQPANSPKLPSSPKNTIQNRQTETQNENSSYSLLSSEMPNTSSNTPKKILYKSIIKVPLKKPTEDEYFPGFPPGRSVSTCDGFLGFLPPLTPDEDFAGFSPSDRLNSERRKKEIQDFANLYS